MVCFILSIQLFLDRLRFLLLGETHCMIVLATYYPHSCIRAHIKYDCLLFYVQCFPLIQLSQFSLFPFFLRINYFLGISFLRLILLTYLGSFLYLGAIYDNWLNCCKVFVCCSYIKI